MSSAIRELDLLRRLLVISVRNDDRSDIAMFVYDVAANFEGVLVEVGEGNAVASLSRARDLPAVVTGCHIVTIDSSYTHVNIIRLDGHSKERYDTI